MPRFLRPFLIALTLLLGGLFVSSPSALAAPQINNQINYQARLMDSSGFPVADGNYSIIFSLYDASTAGNRLWTAAGTLGAPTAITVNVQNGLFTVLLGDTGQNTLDTVNWNSDQLYLGVTINADAEMSPRKRFASAPSAFNARQLQGMYASSTASGGQTLFTLNQTQNDAATGTRSALDVRSNGTSNSNDFLVRGINDTNTVVFSINRQGSVTSTNVFVSGLTSSTNLNANIASFATATVAGQGICLSNGQFCSTGSVTESDTLQTVSNRGSFTTTTLTLFGGLTVSNISATGTLNVTGASTLNGLTFTNATGTNVTSTNVFGVNGSFTNLSVNSLGVVGITWTNATGTNTTSTNFFASNLLFSNATGGTLLATTVSTTNLTVTGQLVCLADGTNCPSGTSPNLQTVTNAGNTTTNAIQFAGGTSTADFIFNTSATVNGVLISLTATSTNLFANSAAFATATVSGQAVCLSNGVGCPTVASEADTLLTVSNRGSIATSTLTLFGGFIAASSSVTGTLNIAGALNVTGASNFQGATFTNATATNVTSTSVGVTGTATIGNATASTLQANIATFATATVAGQGICLSNGVGCAVSGGEVDTLQTVTNRGAFTTTTSQFFGGFVAASSSVTGTLNVFGNIRATGTAEFALTSTSSPFTIRGLAPDAGDFSYGLTYNTTGTGGIRLGDTYAGSGIENISFINFTNDFTGASDQEANLSYFAEANQMSMQVAGPGSNGSMLQLTDLDNELFGFGADGAVTLRKYSQSATSSILQLWNLGTNQGSVTLNVGEDDPNTALVDGNNGSIYFRSVAGNTTSGTIAYIKTSSTNPQSWVGLATVDMLTSGTSSGPEADTLQTVTNRGSFTTTTTQFFGGFVAASSSVTGTLNVMGNVNIGSPTTSLNSAFVLNGNDLYVEGNIGSASSIYTNGEFVVGPSSTHYADGRISKVDNMEEFIDPGNYAFEFQVTGGILLQAAPDTVNAAPGAIGLYAGNGTSTLFSGSEVNLQAGAGYNVGFGGAVSIIGGGSGTSTFSSGGTVYISGGSAISNGSGGGVSLVGTDAFGTGSGGSLSLQAGSAFSGGFAGNINITAGSNFGGGNGADINLTPGLSSGGFTGNVVLNSGFGFAPPELRFNETLGFGSEYVGFRAPTSVGTSRVWVLPNGDGTSGQVLSTDGAGNLSFINAGGGGGGDSNWTYSAASNTYLTVTSTANVIIGGTTTTINGAPLFTMDGNDLLVTGSIGTDRIFATGRVDAPYLNRWFTSPLLTQTVNRGGRANVPVGAAPHGVAFDGSHIWVSNYNDTAANSLSKIDPLTNTVVATTSLPGLANNADGMAFDGKYLWVGAEDGSDAYVHKINVITNQVVASVALSTTFRFPQSVAYDGRYIWVTHTGSFPSSSIVSQVDPNTNTVVAEIPVGVSPYGVAFDGEYIWVANLDSATVNKISPTTSSVVATTTGVLNANGVVFDGSFIWVSSAFQSLVYKINPRTAAIVGTVALESGANAQHMAFDGTYIWVAQLATTTIAKIDPRINSVVERVEMPGASRSIAVDGSHVWVTNSLFSDYVTKIPYGVGNGAASNLSVGSLLINASTGSATGTSNYALTIAYASATTFGGICIDDISTGATCPTTGIGASIVADGPIIANRFDLAEMYSVTGTYEVGDVLVLDASSTATVKTSPGTAYDSKVIGIVSTDPGFVLGWTDGAKVALTGRVPVKVSMNNGPIHVGDSLVSSDVPGYAMKATRPGMVLGYALEDASATGTVQVFVSVGFWAGMAFGEDGSIKVDDDGNVSIMNDLHIGGRLFPSLKGGGIQNDWYLFIDDTDPTSTYLSTNADGFQSMDTYDFAERYYSPDQLEPGDLVVVSDNGRTHVQRSLNEDDMLLGIVSTRPAFIAGRPATSTYPIALSGRVPTKVSGMNGAIKAGDPLAPTSIPGVAAKAVRSGPIVGLALEDFDGADISKIEVFVNPTYWVNENEVAEAKEPEVSSEIVVSQGKQGFATISAGAKKVRIEFPSLNAYPNVQVTPRGSTGGAWWTDGYSDSGFEIIMQETQDHDVVFAWRVEATAGGDVMRMSDGTYAPVDPLTGMPTDWITTSTEPIVDEDEVDEPEPIIETPEEMPELEEEFISEEEVPVVSTTSTETP